MYCMKILEALLFLLLSLSATGQTITTIAGNGSSSGSSGDGGSALIATINAANGGAIDKFGNYYVAEVFSHRIRKISVDGIISTVAGNGSSGYSGDGGIATNAKLNNPTAIALDSIGNIYIDDQNNFRIRKVDFFTGIISTIAGTGVSGFNGDNIPATNAHLGGVEDLCIDYENNIYISDQVNNRIRKISTTGIISTVAGYGGFSSTGTGDGGPATAATFNWLSGITTDKLGNVYVADYNGGKIRKISKSGIIISIAGNGGYIFTLDNVPATSASFNPLRITFDRNERLVIADKYNKRIYLVDGMGIIKSIVGNGLGGFSGDGGPASAASLDFPAGVVYDTCGNLYIAESNNRRVRKVTFNPECLPLNVTDVNSELREVKVYPNPMLDELNVRSEEAIQEVALYNAVGQLVLHGAGGGQRSAKLAVGQLPAGVYMVRVNGQYVNRIVKQ